MVKNTIGKNWKKISQKLKTKSPQQCSYRYHQILLKKNIKKFSRVEDILIIELYEKHGENWDVILKSFPGRHKQELIERYFNKLNPEANKRRELEFDSEEDALLISLHSKHGNNWNEIAKSFKNRTVYMLKNRYYSVLKNLLKNNSNSSIHENNSNNSSNSNNNIYNSRSKNNYNNTSDEKERKLYSLFSCSDGRTINDEQINYSSKNKYTYDTISYSDDSSFEYNKCFAIDDDLTISNNSNYCTSEKKKIYGKYKDNNIYNELSFIQNRGLFVKNNKNDENSAKNYDESLQKNSNEKVNLNKSANLQLNNNNDFDNGELMTAPNDHDPNHITGNRDINFDDFIRDFENIDKVSYELITLENIHNDFLNDSYLKNNYFSNSNFDYNSTSLLDLLEDEDFSKDFLSRNTTRNSGDSLKYSSNNDNSNESPPIRFRTGGTAECRNINTSKNSSMKNDMEIFKFNNTENNSWNTNDKSSKYNNNNSSNCYKFNSNFFDYENFEQNNYDFTIRDEKFCCDDKMLIDDSEMQSIPNNFYRMEEDYSEYSRKINEVDVETRNNFNVNYIKCFESSEQARKRCGISDTNANSKEVIEKMLIKNQINSKKETLLNINNNNYNVKINNIDCNNKLNSETETDTKGCERDKIRRNPHKDINKEVIKQYRQLQDVYKKYKQFKNLKIKIEGLNESGYNINENIKKVLDEDKRLNLENDRLAKELINMRKEYKKYAAEVRTNKKINNSMQMENQKDQYFLRNSLLKQIDVLIQMIKTLKIKVDLIRNFNKGKNISGNLFIDSGS